MPGLPDRADDERVLSWLRLRSQGHSSGEVALRYGATSERVRTATQRVRQADIEESGEPDVGRYYW